MTFLERVFHFAWLPSLATGMITQAKQTVVVHGSGVLESQLHHCAKFPPRMMVRTSHALLASADDGFVRFAVTKTRNDGGKVEFADLVLEDAAGRPIDLLTTENVLQARLDGPNVLETHGSVDFCIDGKTETSCRLEIGQSIILQLRPGHQVASYGFKTALENSTKVRSCDPIAFKMETSDDGSFWREVSVKAAVNTPSAGGLMVGPFLLSGSGSGGPAHSEPPMMANEVKVRTTTARLVPADAGLVPVMTTVPPPAAAPIALTPSPPAVMPLPVEPILTTTSTPRVPIPDVPADAPSRVASAVIDAAEQSGMPLPQRMAAATAAAAAAKSIVKPASKEAIAEAAAAAGLDPSHLQAVSAALEKASPARLPALLAVWRAAADAARHAAERGPEKVSHVVEASAAAGLSIEQQAQAAAAAAVAAVASMTTPGPEAVITAAVKAAEEAGMALDKQSQMAAVVQVQPPQDQGALVRILHAAEILPRTTPPPEEVPEFDGSSPAAKVVADAITQVIRDIPVSPQQKLQVVSAAARAAQVAAEHSSTTTSFDGVQMVMEAAEAAGIKDVEKLQKVREKAEELTPEKQMAVSKSLEAAADEPSTTPVHAAAKVAAVVKAAADSGMTEEQQAEVAAAAASAMAKAAEPAPKEQISELIKAAKSLGLGDSELEAILASASSLTPAELESVIKSMRAAQDS